MAPQGIPPFLPLTFRPWRGVKLPHFRDAHPPHDTRMRRSFTGTVCLLLGAMMGHINRISMNLTLACPVGALFRPRDADREHATAPLVSSTRTG